MAKIKFLPQNIEIEVDSNFTLLQLAHKNNIDIKSVCKGKLNCAECRVRIVEGEGNLTPPTAQESNLLGTSGPLEGKRYSCQVYCYGDVTVDLTEQLHRDETMKKKIRGFKSTKNTTESQAVVDTILLSGDKKK